MPGNQPGNRSKPAETTKVRCRKLQSLDEPLHMSAHLCSRSVVMVISRFRRLLVTAGIDDHGPAGET
jgi:hypothetical protein